MPIMKLAGKRASPLTPDLNPHLHPWKADLVAEKLKVVHV